MRLAEIALAGFQSYRSEQQVPIEPGVTFLVGRNNVGKSAFLRSLLLWRAPQEGVTESFRLTYRWTVDKTELGERIPALTEVQAWAAAPSEGSLEVSYTASGIGTVGSEQMVPREMRFGPLVAAQGPDGLTWRGEPSPANTRGVAALEDLARHGADHLVYVAPRHIELFPQGTVWEESKLAPDARNLGNVLKHVRETYATTKWRELMAFVKDAFPEIDEIAIPTVPDQSAQQGEPRLFYTGLPEGVPLRLSGTGVQQLLALATALVLAEGTELVLIDEPQAYLHPHAERALVRLMAQHPGHQYVLATHSSSILTSAPLSSARLLTLGEGGTECLVLDKAGALLSELGISPAGLWLPDAILWVEGPTEEQVFVTLLAAEADPTALVGVAVRQVPAGASQFIARSTKRAEAAYRFCEEAVAAIAPLPTKVRFLFDRDARTPEIIERLREVSRGSARFLEVREIENLFLDVAVLEAFFRDLCDRFELEPPTAQSLADRLAQLLAATDDLELYPDGPPPVNGANEDYVKGSSLLDSLCNEYLRSQYRKVDYAELLTRLTLNLNPARLAPLRLLVEDLAATSP